MSYLQSSPEVLPHSSGVERHPRNFEDITQSSLPEAWQFYNSCLILKHHVNVMLPSAIFPDHMWQEFFWGRKIQNSFPPKFQVTWGGCAECVLWFHVPLAWCPVFEQHSFQWRKQEVAQIKGFCLFPAEEDLHSGTARKPVLPTQRTAFPEEQTHVPCPRVDSLQGEEKKARPKINNRAAHEKDMHITRKERDLGANGARDKGGEGKTKPQHKAEKQARKKDS